MSENLSRLSGQGRQFPEYLKWIENNTTKYTIL